MTLDSLLADERALGYGAGLSFVAPLGMTQAVGRLMRDFGPVTLRMCLRIRVRELRRPMGFCNPYFSVDDAVADLSQAGGMVDFFDLAPLHVERAVGQRARPDRREAGRAPARARPAARPQGLAHPRAADGPAPARRAPPHRGARARAALAEAGQAPPPHHPRRRRGLLGGGADPRADRDARGRPGGGGGVGEPSTVRQLARQIRDLHRVPGIYARWDHRPARLARRSGEVSYEGRARLRVRVTPRARR